MEKFSVKINDNIPDIYREIITKYWEWNNENYSFKYDRLALQVEYSLKQYEFTNIIEESKAVIDYGECCECKDQIYISSRNRSQLRNRKRDINIRNQFFCSVCRSELNKEISSFDPIEKKRKLMRHAFKYKIWEKLTYDEMNILKAIITFSTWKDIYTKVISINYEYVYPTFKNLDEMHLLYIERDVLSEKIINVHCHNELKNKIFKKKI